MLPQLLPARSSLLIVDTGKDALYVLDAWVVAPALASATLVSPTGLIFCSSAVLAEPAVLAFPLNVATMLCAPRLKADVLHTAVVPLTGTAPQPAKAAPASVNATLPEGTAAVTAAVSNTVEPVSAGLAELESSVLLGALTTCANVPLVEPLFAESPE